MKRILIEYYTAFFFNNRGAHTSLDLAPIHVYMRCVRSTEYQANACTCMYSPCSKKVLEQDIFYSPGKLKLGVSLCSDLFSPTLRL